MRSIPLGAAAVVAIAGGGLAQQVFVVAPAPGPGVFATQIQPAVDAAVDGDFVLVKPGSYAGFTIDAKALSIVGDVGGVVTVSQTVTIRDLAAEQAVHLANVSIVPSASSELGLLLDASAGPIWIEDSSIQGGAGGPLAAGGTGAQIAGCGSIVLQRATVAGGAGFSSMTSFFVGTGGIGLVASSSNVTLYDVDARGGTGGSGTGLGHPSPAIGKAGGPGSIVAGSLLFTSGVRFLGGNAGSSAFGFGGGTGAPGSDGLRLQTTAAAHALDTAFVAGPAGNGGAPGTALVVAPTATLTTLPGTARHFEVSSPLREQQTVALDVEGVAGEVVAVVASPKQDSGFLFLAISGVVLTDLSLAFAVDLGMVPPSGALTVSVPIGDLPPSLLAETLFLQPIHFDPVLTTAVLGPGGALVVLDGSL